MQNIFDYDVQANRSVLGGASATRALGIPTAPGLPGTFAPGASNASADAILQQATQDTQAMRAPRPGPARAPTVGYNPATNEVFSAGRTFQLDLDQGVANAQLLDMDNPELPQGFVPVYGDEVKARLKREYEGLGLVDSMQRRGGQMISNLGSTAQDIGLPGAQTMQDYGGALARRNPSHIMSTQDMLDNPGTTVSEAIGEVAVDVPVALAQTAVGAKIGAGVGALAAPFTGGLSIPIGAILGGGAGRFIGSLAETYGSVRAEQRSAGMDDRGRALAAGAGSAALEALLGPEAILGGRIASGIAGKAADMTLSQAARQGTYGHIGRQLAAGAVVEGPLTETPQSVIERWGAGKALTGDEAMDEYAIGAVKGAIGGAAASPLASLPEYGQARNFIANLNEDMRIAADLNVPTPERLAAARRVQDVYRGSSDDPQLDAQLQAFREKLRVLDEQHLAVTQAQDAGEAVATGAPANLMHLATPLDRDRSAEQDARLADKAAAPEPAPELSSILAAGRAGEQWQEMQAQREQALQAAEQLAPQVQNVLDTRSREVIQRGDLIEQVGAAAQPIVQGLEAQALPPAIEQAGQQFDQVMSGNMQAALEDPDTFGPYLDWQNAAMGGEEGVASPIAPMSPVGPTSPLRPAAPQPAATTLPPSQPAPAEPTMRPVAPAPSTPAVVSSADADLSPGAGNRPGGLSSLEARTASNVGTVTGTINVPRAVQDAVSRALRGGKSPVVYDKGNIDTAATETWSERMRAMVDAAKGVVEAFHALDSREANLAPKSSMKGADATPTDATNTKATEAAGTAYADVQRLRGQLRNAIDTLRNAAGGDKNVEGIVANLKGKTQEIKSKTADRAKSDTALDTRLSRAWAMYKDGALDVFESADVVRGRPVRESFEQKQKGATEPPLVTAERDGSPRHPMVQGAKETDAAFRKRKENATERGVNGTLAYLQLHGTGYERLLAAAVSRALRRFDGTPDAPKIKWVTAEETAAYDPKSNTILLHTEASPEELLHETLHAALQWYVYQNPEIEEVRLLDKALQKVLDAPASAFTGKAAEVVAVLRKVDKGRSKTARLDAILELISYGSTLREFRQALKDVGTVKDGNYLVSGLTNLWNKITQLVQKFLGVSNSLANDVLDGTVALLEQAADPGIDTPGKRKGSKLQLVDTDTAAFARWFGNSKVVDANGKPLVVYHGTRTGGFTEFSPRTRKGEQLGFGVHFATDEAFARRYADDDTVARKGNAPDVYAVYLKAENPLFADSVVVEGTPEFALAAALAGSKLFTVKNDAGKRAAYLQTAIDAASPQRAEAMIRAAGYDAVRYESRIGTRGVGARTTSKAQSWLVFEPTQIKSAVGNRGTFDPMSGDILKAEVASTPFDDPTDMPEEQAIARPGAALPTAVDVKRYNKRVLPEVASTKMLFDLVGWGKAAEGIEKGGAWVGENVRKHFPGLARWVRYIAPRFNVPQDVAAAFDQYKDDKQAGYKLTERLATFIQHRPPEQQLRIFEYLDGDKAALKDDPATAEIADQVLRWRDFYVDRIPDEKVKRRFASGKFSETMLFANDSESVASQTFGARKLSAMLGEKKQVEENLEEGWMMLDDRGDPVLDGVFYEVYRTNPDGSRMHDGFMARDQFDRTGAPVGHFVDTEYVWFHTGHKDGRHTFRASMTVPQAVQARKGEALANALRNTMAALSVNFASLEFARGLASHGHSTGNPELAVAFDSVKAAEAALGIKIDPRTVLDAGSEDARSAMARHEWSSRGRWVQLPKSKAYGDLSGKLIDAGVWAAMLDMSDRRPLTNVRALNTSMRWFKKAKTIYNPGTHVTNVATNFTLAMVHDIPMGTVKDAARLMLQYELRPNSMTKADRALVLAFMNSNAMVGDFSAAEVKQALYEAMKTSLDDGQPTIAGRLAALMRMEKAKSQAVEKLSKAGKIAGRVDDAATAVYASEDNVFRLAAFLKRAADLAAQRGDGRPTQEDLQKAGDFARWAFLDYDIDSRAVRLARQSVLPFISWTYAVIPVLAKIAVHQPWKIANVLLAYAILEHVMQEVMGGDDEDERLRKAGPEYVRDRVLGFGPYVHIRLPFGDDKNPVYYRLGDYMPWTNVARGQPNGFMGQDWFPSAITPTGPFVSTVLTAMGGIDPYFGKPLNPPTDSMWQKFLTRSREMLGQAAPPVLLDLARGERLNDMVKGRVDKPDGFETLQMARWMGLKAYSFNEDQAKVAQSKAAGAITAEYRKELGRVRRAEARYEDPDWEGLAEKQRELLARLQDELDELRGE